MCFTKLAWLCLSIFGFFRVDAAGAQAGVPPVLTKAIQVIQLTRDQAGAAPPVDLRGVVTYGDPQWNIWFMQDETSGIYMDYPQSKPELRTGHQIRARGTAAPGGFAPIIVGKDVVLQGRAALPKARAFSFDQLAGGAQDCQRVEIEAIVQAAYIQDGHLHLELHPGYRITAFIPGFTNRPAPTQLVDARVRLRGVWGSEFNNKAQHLPSYKMFVASLEDVAVTVPAHPDPFTLPTQPTVNALSFFNARKFGHRIKVAGVVTATGLGGVVYLQDSAGGLRIHTRDPSPLATGERIEVAGFPRVDAVTPLLEESVIRRLGRGVEPAAILIHSTNMLREESDSRLVALEGELVETVPRGDHVELVLHTGTEFFTARLAGTNATRELKRFEPRSILTVSGVCSLEVDKEHRPTSLSLILRSPRDIQTLRSAPWWTVGRAFSLLAVTAFALLAWRLRGFKNESRLKEQFQHVFASSPLATTLHSTSDGRIMDVNAEFLSLLQFTRDEVIGRTSLDLGIWCDSEARTRLLTLMKQGVDVRDFEVRFRGKNGQEHDISLSTQFVQLPTGILAMMQAADITSRKRAEELEQQANRAQRLQSIGTLAGGIAHDLNNALAPITMAGGLLHELFPGESEILDTIQSSAQRAAGMVRQLLTFAKGAEGVDISINPHQLITEMEKIIKATFPKTIQLRTRIQPHLPKLRGDPTQLHQVLLNLCVNARDAMPDGGTLTLEAVTELVNASSATNAHVGTARFGQYVMFRVTDTGTGIPQEILDRVFDPFFTTKGPSKGTGLGLSTVLGIVRGHGGFIQLDTQPGSGTTFAVSLPIDETSREELAAPPAVSAYQGSGECILYVDDEEAQRDVATAILRQLNFNPLTASDGRDGLRMIGLHAAELRVVITDVEMPEMNGLAFARALREILPDIPLLAISGSLSDSQAAEFLSLGACMTIEKPFTNAILAEALSDALREPEKAFGQPVSGET